MFGTRSKSASALAIFVKLLACITDKERVVRQQAMPLAEDDCIAEQSGRER
jgi:hypothetical protein